MFGWVMLEITRVAFSLVWLVLVYFLFEKNIPRKIPVVKKNSRGEDLAGKRPAGERPSGKIFAGTRPAKKRPSTPQTALTSYLTFCLEQGNWVIFSFYF